MCLLWQIVLVKKKKRAAAIPGLPECKHGWFSSTKGKSNMRIYFSRVSYWSEFLDWAFRYQPVQEKSGRDSEPIVHSPVPVLTEKGGEPTHNSGSGSGSGGGPQDTDSPPPPYDGWQQWMTGGKIRNKAALLLYIMALHWLIHIFNMIVPFITYEQKDILIGQSIRRLQSSHLLSNDR